MKNNLEKCLDALCISRSDYCSVINGLARVSTGNTSVSSTSSRLDKHDWFRANAVVERFFGNCSIRAEDRGPVYAVWINTTADDGSLRRVLFFAEIPWTRRTSLPSHLKKETASSSVAYSGQSRRAA